jgi:endonuclease/exonuclease/phosphatase family metal-dependent hydrolase
MRRLKTAVAVQYIALALLIAGACGPKLADRPPLPAECPAAADREAVRWYQVDDPHERGELLRWCAAVGPPVIVAGPPASGPVDSLAVVCWNTHVGGGSLGYFIRQLRAGELTGGRPVKDFVVLMQEAFREGAEVPARLSDGARYAGEIFPERELGTRRDVRRVATEEGLHAFYVPSMRNGDDEDPPEDRGNAILSTLPMAEYRAWELPIERQRRVTIGASVQGRTSDGRAWRLSMIDVHLDNRSGIRSLVRSFTRVRLEQTRFLLDSLPAGGAAVLGGDLNTWLGEKDEPAVRLIRQAFPIPEVMPSLDTYEMGAFLDRQTDFLFFRLPDGWRARYRRIDDTYGSDHYPLLGWVVFDSRPVARDRNR